MLTGQLGRTRQVGRARLSWRKVIRSDLDAIECEDYPAMVSDRKSWRKKIKGPYTAQAEVAPIRRSLRLAVLSQRKGKEGRPPSRSFSMGQKSGFLKIGRAICSILKLKVHALYRFALFLNFDF